MPENERTNADSLEFQPVMDRLKDLSENEEQYHKAIELMTGIYETVKESDDLETVTRSALKTAVEKQDWQTASQAAIIALYCNRQRTVYAALLVFLGVMDESYDLPQSVYENRLKMFLSLPQTLPPGVPEFDKEEDTNRYYIELYYELFGGRPKKKK